MRFGAYLVALVIFGAFALADDEPSLPPGGLAVSAPGYAIRTPGSPWQYVGGWTTLKNFPHDGEFIEFGLPGPLSPILTVQAYRWHGRWDRTRPAAENLLTEMAWRLAEESRDDWPAFRRLVKPQVSAMQINGAPCVRWNASAVPARSAPRYYDRHGKEFGLLCSHPEFPGFAVEMTATQFEGSPAPAPVADREAFFASLHFTPLGARITELRLAGRPWQLAESEGALWVLETGRSGQCCDGMSVARIDPTTNAIVARIAVGRAGRIVADPHGIWVFGDRLVRIDPATNKIAGSIAVPKEATSIRAGSGYLWVVDRATDHLIRIDPVTGAQRAIGGLGKSLGEIAVLGNTVYVSRWWEDGLLAVDAETGSVIRTIAARRFPFELKVLNGMVWAINNNDGDRRNSVVAFDPSKPESLVLGDVAPNEALDLARWNGRLVVMTAGALAVIDLDSRASYLLPVPGGDSNGVATAGSALWVAGADALFRFDPK